MVMHVYLHRLHAFTCGNCLLSMYIFNQVTSTNRAGAASNSCLLVRCVIATSQVLPDDGVRPSPVVVLNSLSTIRLQLLPGVVSNCTLIVKLSVLHGFPLKITKQLK